MSDEVCLSYDELCEKLRSEIGKQVFQLALQARVIARTADSQLRGDYANPGICRDHRPDSVQDFLDLCFNKQLPNQS